MAGYPEYYKISYSAGERVVTVCDNPKKIPVPSPQEQQQNIQKAKSLFRAMNFKKGETNGFNKMA